jgi:hypothetical protein
MLPLVGHALAPQVLDRNASRGARLGHVRLARLRSRAERRRTTRAMRPLRAAQRPQPVAMGPAGAVPERLQRSPYSRRLCHPPSVGAHVGDVLRASALAAASAARRHRHVVGCLLRRLPLHAPALYARVRKAPVALGALLGLCRCCRGPGGLDCPHLKARADLVPTGHFQPVEFLLDAVEGVVADLLA